MSDPPPRSSGLVPALARADMSDAGALRTLRDRLGEALYVAPTIPAEKERKAWIVYLRLLPRNEPILGLCDRSSYGAGDTLVTCGARGASTFAVTIEACRACGAPQKKFRPR